MRRARPIAASRWPLLLALATLVTLTSALVAAGAQRMPDATAPREPGVAAQLERGREVYAFWCTTCHGATGQGFAEARSAFPADHYDCSRCHMPRNPAAMTPAEIELAQSVFSLGDPPPLADAAALARFGTAAGLFGYVRATMPRWDPGILDDEAFLDVTAYVLHLSGVPLEDELTFASLVGVELAAGNGD